MGKKRYENTEGGHSKFWELQKTKGGWDAFYGKIDGTAQGPKFYSDDEVEKVIASKVKKGYVLV
jgi:hypothetical protein